MEEKLIEDEQVSVTEETESDRFTEVNEPTEREKMLEDKLFCIQNGVPEENCAVVLAAASTMENPDRKAAITEVLERYPFFRPAKGTHSDVTTGVHLECIEESPLSGVEEAFFMANPDCKM